MVLHIVCIRRQQATLVRAIRTAQCCQSSPMLAWGIPGHRQGCSVCLAAQHSTPWQALLCSDQVWPCCRCPGYWPMNQRRVFPAVCEKGQSRFSKGRKWWKVSNNSVVWPCTDCERLWLPAFRTDRWKAFSQSNCKEKDFPAGPKQVRRCSCLGCCSFPCYHIQPGSPIWELVRKGLEGIGCICLAKRGSFLTCHC